MSILKTYEYDSKVCVSTLKKKKLKATHDIKVSKNLLIWAAIYCNKNVNQFTNQYDLKLYMDHIYADINYYFDLRSHYLRLNNALIYEEDSYISNSKFDIGNIIANINAKKILGVKHLYHTKWFKAKSCKSILPGPGPKICDFVGENSMNYFMIEAKCTKDEKTLSRPLYEAHQQLSSSGIFKGKKVTKKYASVAYVKSSSGNLESQFVDPLKGTAQVYDFDDFKYEYLPVTLLKDSNCCNELADMIFVCEHFIFGFKKDCTNEKTLLFDYDGKKYEGTLFSDGIMIACLFDEANKQ